MTCAVILAAGASRRMGAVKPLARMADGRTFLAALTGTLRSAGIDGPIVVVTGAHRSAVAREARRLGASPVHCARWRDGQLASARTGLRAALAAGGDAALLPCDMPHLASATVARTLRARPPAVAAHGGRTGHPLLLDPASLRAVLAARGAATLRAALRQAGVRPLPVPVRDRAVHENVNTPGQLRAWERSPGARASRAAGVTGAPPGGLTAPRRAGRSGRASDRG